MHDEINKIIIMGSLLFLVLIIGTINIKDKFKQVPLPVLESTKPASQNYILQDNKIVPLTKLSDEDAKKPCLSCHTF